MRPGGDTVGSHSPRAPRAAIYVRISSDRNDGLGVARQEHACRGLLDTIGGTLVGVYCDNDHSAYAARPRPAYENLLSDVAGGEVDLVIAWHPDRLYRRQQDLVRFVDTLDAARAGVATVTSGLLDLSTASGRMVARVVGAVAQHEVEQQGQRLKHKQKELAGLGRWGGGRRPYGYQPTGAGGLEIVPEEAAILREVADRILAGETVSSVKKELNRRRIPAWGGGTWGDSSLRRILTSPTICGLRVRHGAVVGGAQWEPIIDEVTVELVSLVLANQPGRRTARSRTGLLNPWLISCGRCGSPLRARMQGRARVYQCLSPPRGHGCGHLTIVGAPADSSIRAAVMGRLTSEAWPRPRAPTLPDDGRQHTVAVIEARLRELAVACARQQVTEAEWQAARRPLLDSLRDGRAALHAQRWRAALARAADLGDFLPSRWEQWPLEDQQDLVEAVVERVTVSPGGSPGGRFDPRRVLDGTTWRP